MKENAETLRRALKSVRRPRPNTAYPRELRARAADYIGKRRAAGEGWGRIGLDLGLSPTTAMTWLETSRGPSRASTKNLFLPVTMKRKEEEKVGGVSLVTPGGFRFEGLDVKGAAALWRQLR